MNQISSALAFVFLTSILFVPEIYAQENDSFWKGVHIEMSGFAGRNNNISLLGGSTFKEPISSIVGGEILLGVSFKKIALS